MTSVKFSAKHLPIKQGQCMWKSGCRVCFLLPLGSCSPTNPRSCLACIPLEGLHGVRCLLQLSAPTSATTTTEESCKLNCLLPNSEMRLYRDPQVRYQCRFKPTAFGSITRPAIYMDAATHPLLPAIAQTVHCYVPPNKPGRCTTVGYSGAKCN